MATVVSVVLTGNAEIDGLLGGTKWSGTVTYSFPDSATDYSTNYGYGETAPTTFSPAPTAMRAAAQYAVSLVTSYTNLTVNVAASNASDVMIAQSSVANPTSYAYLPNADYLEGGDVWFGTSYDFSRASLGNYYFFVALHEIGHAFGLKHSEAEDVGDIAVPSQHDAMEFTIMSSRSYVGATSDYVNEDYGYAQTYMANDILALQTLYGANYSTHNENTTYAWDPATGQAFINGVAQPSPGEGVGVSANRIFETVWDGGGTDTYDFSNYATGLKINLNPGASSVLSNDQLANLGNDHYASGNIYNAYLFNGDPRSLIENAIGGSGNDTIIGNTADNYLFGGNGNDDLYGLSGHNTLDGGAGFDRAFYDGAFSSFALSFPGLGQVQVSATGIADTLTNIEQLVFNDRLYDVPVSQSVSLDSGNQFAWNTSTTRFDWQGKAIDITLSNDDGTITSFSYDTLSQFAWTKVVSYLDTSHRTYLTVYTNDDGTSVNYQYNTDGTHSWSSVQANYNAQGQTSVTYNNNDLTTITYQFDLSHTQTWSSLITDYDSQMRTQTISYHQDDGTLVVYQYDNASNQTWSSLVTTYDSQQNVQSVIYNNDDGGAVVYQYDTAHTYNWTDIATYFATGMIKDHDVYDLDNGGHVYHQYDPSSGTIAKTLVYDANWTLIA